MKKLQVWDLPIRIFHALLIVCVSFSFISAEIGGLWLNVHMQCGTVIIAALAFRLLWGFFGSYNVRFIHFFPTPSRLRQQLSGNWKRAGHTPLGAISVLVMLIGLSIQAILGLFAMNDEIDIHGPLNTLVSTPISEQLTRWHTVWSDVILLLIILHIVAVLFYRIKLRKDLITPMIHGRMEINNQVNYQESNKVTRLTLISSLLIAFFVFFLIDSGTLSYWLTANSSESVETTIHW